MKVLFFSALCLTVMSCVPEAASERPAPGQCLMIAKDLQYIAGMEAMAALEEIEKQPEFVKNMTIYSGSSEDPSILPKRVIVLEHNTPRVTDALFNGGRVTKVYCNL